MPRRYQQGAVAIVIALLMVVMMAFLGLVIDLGRLFIYKTELSNAADACALAAARELTGSADSLAKAESAAMTVAARNFVDFQATPVSIVPADVGFSDHVNGAFLKASDVPSGSIANMKYARCLLPQDGILPYFMQVMGFGPQSVASQAVAGLAPGITNCGIPVAICKQTATTCAHGATPDAFGLCHAEWYGSRFSAGSGYTGSFNLIDYSPPNGGASELADLLTGSGQCDLTISTPVGQTGLQQSIAKAWNTRFGLYQGSASVATAPPDYTGYAYTPVSFTAQYNAFPDFQAKRLAHAIYQGDSAAGLSLTGGTKNSTIAELQISGTDRRLAIMSIVDCAGWTGSQTVPIVGNACVLMLHPMEGANEDVYVEYRGSADLPGNPCATLGLPGGPGSVGPKVPTLVR